MKAHQQPKKLGILALALLCLPVAGAWAQTGGAAAPSGQMKIAILNVRQAIVATAEGKQASAQLQTQFAAQQNDLQAMQKQIRNCRIAWPIITAPSVTMRPAGCSVRASS